MKKITFFSIVLLLSVSCDDILQEEPKNIISANQFFTNEAEAEAAVFGVYGTLTSHDGNFLRWFDTYKQQGSELLFTARPMPNTRLFAVNDLDVSNSQVLNIWQVFYQGIKDANLVINRISDSSLPDGVKNYLVAETKFLRALFYYNLTKFWGDVPYWTDELEIDVISQIGMTSREEIWASLLTELDEVEDVLPAGTQEENGGRASRWSAKMLKARIYMWQEDWSSAIGELESIAQESPHRLLDNYGDVFRGGNELNDEVIFAAEFLVDQHVANKLTFYRPRTVEESIPNPGWFNGAPIFTPYESYALSFSENDLREPYCIMKTLEGQPFNFNYMPKFMRTTAPESDPLMEEPERRYNSSIPFLLMRLADAYLLLSEAENELNGPSPKAYQYINAVRNRAGLNGLSGLSQQELREVIYQERAWELAGEGEGRRIDLIRWGIYVETIKALPDAERAAIDGNPTVSEFYKSKALFEVDKQAGLVSEKHRLLPIPASEIEKNPNLVQNPLWQ